MTTVLDVIKSSFKKAQILTQDESPSNSEAQDALKALNELLDSWSNEGWFQPSRVRESLSLTANQSEYTIGSGGDFNTTRPLKIISAFVRQSSIDYHLRPLSLEGYDEIVNKSTSVSIPECYTYSNEYPLGKINLYPVPYAGLTLHLMSEKPLTTYTALTDTVTVPPGWLRAIKWNLAVEILSEYGQEVSANLIKGAKDSKASIIKNTVKNKIPYNNRAAETNNNIYGGYWR